ncbi:NAD(P)/FAD-dependent oxidoreductase [Asanoa sp. WMMD1127]|uniref:NAD(P)/FAD-dependent oxidoreductase n=1 Tax=Asanoa sp. WMMD1127 TaxID=3016107 RepID=UPI002417E900|nr:NAD(P)/FAD-dependent oxidoreductase [Asanoa sp. WMMD1127]MDG4824126.1 NAD(P)/FAD-dependent oxidoreductase [Asanoa sp. WMMD1127]
MARPRVVIVGGGFAGFHAAHKLTRLARGRADITLINPTDYLLYVPLLPEVAVGVLEPRQIAVSLTSALPGVKLALGEANALDLEANEVHYTDAEGGSRHIPYDRLVIALGSVNKLLPIPGVADHAHGFRGVPEALFLHDHIVRQLEMAQNEPDPGECLARCTFVVVGAGYTGTEVAAHGVQFTDLLAKQKKTPIKPTWILLDLADRVLPELDPRMSKEADRVLRERGVEVLMGTSVQEALFDGVRLTDGRYIPTRSLVWCVGVRPDPVVDNLGLPTDRGRIVVDEYLRVPGHPRVYAIGDAAAVPDPENPGRPTPMTAQHAVRHGKQAAHNIAAEYGTGKAKPYRHKDLGFVVDLGGLAATANPFGVVLAGLPAMVATRGYHLLSLPGNRIRVVGDWLLHAFLPRHAVQLGLIRGPEVPLDNAAPELPVRPPAPARSS